MRFFSQDLELRIDSLAYTLRNLIDEEIKNTEGEQ